MTKRNASSKAPARTGGRTSPRSSQPADHDDKLAQRARDKEAAARRSLHISLISIGGFVVVVTVVAILWWQSSTKAAAEREALLKRRNELRTELLAEGSLAPEKAPVLIQRIEATRGEWEKMSEAELITRQLEQARGVVAASAAQQAIATDLAAVQKEIATPNLSADAWQQLRPRVAAMLSKLPKGPSELRKQLEALTIQVDVGTFDALVGKADALGADARGALTALTAAEDLASECSAAHKDKASHELWTPRLRLVAGKLDTAQQAVFTAPAIAAVALEDLKTKEAEWVPSNAQNLTRRFDGEALTLECAGGDKAKSGLVVLRHHDWHACTLAFDVTLAKGKATLLPRTATQFGEKDTGAVVLTTAAAPGAIVVPAGKEVHVEITVVGDHVTATVDGGAPQQVENRVTNTERCGSFAAVTAPDTAVTLRHFRIRRLS